MLKTENEEALAQMLAADFLIANEDRHLHNFGAVRNAETLEWIGIAPIYDSGTSMWFDAPNIRIGTPEKSKPFRTTHDEQIKPVASLDFTCAFGYSGLGARNIRRIPIY